ncbi:putative LRR receptor-like serine/threonine-protein kinase [Planoprotostelium fungivorum]|uniref:Putative LRR receptor-like serine/threonine-protein kinase n=1 Tax=Planoprotostelium fungivorum TaxID=1890364 RepID=A0A2P6N3B5_9EUKA|nr:putative LRR receptor-like serine/threonine-protein kinase [Planoprotostelium fungivorum]
MLAVLKTTGPAAFGVDKSSSAHLNNLRIAGGGPSEAALISQPCTFIDPKGYLSINCDVSNTTVTSLALQGLNGNLSSDIGVFCLSRVDLISAGLLTNLTSLTIMNSVKGPLPASLRFLTRLQQLTITGNQIDSAVPDLSTIRNLTVIDLSNNGFTGDVPSYWCDQVQPSKINIQYNQFTGNISFINKCSAIQWFRVGWNPLSGEMPASLFNSSMTDVDVGNTQMTFPSVPPFFSGPSNLYSLSLRNMGITTIPSWLAQRLTNLQQFYLDGNQISSLPSNFGTSLQNCTYIDLGTNLVPTSDLPMLFGMKNLVQLILNRNRFNGTIGQISQTSNVQLLDLSLNSLSGDLSFLQMMVNLRDLNLRKAFRPSNQEKREIPSFIESLSQLTYIRASGCNITGSIPNSFVRLNRLQTLDLSDNDLSGSIPSFLNALNFPSLTSIDLSSNSFTLIDENGLSGFSSACSVLDNPLSCFTSLNHSSCSIPQYTTCSLELLHDERTLISSYDAQSILKRYSSSNQNVEVIAVVMTALLRTTKTFTYTSNSASISLQTYNLSVNVSAVIENIIEGQNSSVSLPVSTVTGYGQVSVALSSVDSTPLLSIYDQSIVIGVQVYDGNGREIEIGGVTEKINITMGYIDDISLSNQTVCQWWKEADKIWSREGCDLYLDEARLAVCQCNHLTNFSIGLITANTRAILANEGGIQTRTLIIIICCAAGGSIVILSAIILLFIIQKRRGTKSETMFDLSAGGEEMKGRVKMEGKEREEEGIETWKAECDGVTAVCVMKAVNARGKAELTREAAMLQRQHHPMIVMYLGQDSAEGYIVTEWMNAGTLREYGRRETPDLHVLLKIGEDVAKGMTYIHEQGLVHTHLTANSVYLNAIGGEVTAKIANMRHAVTEGDRAEQRQMGPHTAPEVGREGVYKKASDVYSYGLLLWSMVEQEDISEKTGRYLAARESSVMMTKSWDTGVKALVLDCTQTEDRPRFLDIAKKLRMRRQASSVSTKRGEKSRNDGEDARSYEAYGVIQ